MKVLYKMDLNDIGCEGVDWINLEMAKWRVLVNTVMNLQVTTDRWSDFPPRYRGCLHLARCRGSDELSLSAFVGEDYCI
jgi:hypothetical protein